MTYNVLTGMLNPTHSLTGLLSLAIHPWLSAFSVSGCDHGHY